MVRLCGGEPAPMLFDPPLPIRTPLVVAAAASQPRPLLPPALNILLLSATSATPSHDVHCSRSPVPSAQAAKKKAAVDSGTGRPVASAALLPPPKEWREKREDFKKKVWRIVRKSQEMF
ncbi:hypothetical protein BDA96_03G007600 [Sorghum bicolor]|uniref:Uncharacterized protein n=1 Tax=Sorghum bicolor TaxID=4558 RepID=A0A921RB94_SORBI|nr:uncharacterized protein LOC110434165 isoform X2 [Sorghum bicolor]KAG0535770.1 hypothetical protein BDA96_03G007600 [Sorghum bicolor]|eukprot:XP_021313627.1 uncharacterized protein LOC110434165 isoform X2 [Sorghum bicolor]